MTNLFDLVNYSYTVVKMLWTNALSGFFSNPENDTDETLTTSGALSRFELSWSSFKGLQREMLQYRPWVSLRISTSAFSLERR